MPAVSLADRIIFAVTNVVLYVQHPRFVLKFRKKQNLWPNLARPAGVAELVQWRKLFDRNPLFPVLADKLAVKQWVKERCPELRTPATIWVGSRPEEIPDRLITADHVIKTNNGSSQNYFLGREGVDRAQLSRTVGRWLVGPLRTRWRRLRNGTLEWCYWPIQRQLFVERVVTGSPLVDVSIRASDGVGYLVSCATGYKTESARLGYFWPDGVAANAPVSGHNGLLDPEFEVPPQLGDAVRYAGLLSKGFDYLRVDFLATGGQLYLGEITLYPASGYGAESWRTEAVYRFWLRAIHKSWPMSTPQPWPDAIYLRAFRRWTDGRVAELGSPEQFLSDQRSGISGSAPQ